MKDYQTTINRLRDYADLNAITDGLSRMTFELDALDRARSRDTEAVKIARLVLLLAAAKRAAPRASRQADADDPQLRFALAEIDRQQAEVDRRVKRLIQAGGGVRIGQVGLTKWAAETVRAAEAKRPSARRTASQPKATDATTRSASERFAKLLARYGLAARTGTGEVGFDVDCGCRYRARAQTFVRTRRCGKSTCIAPGTLDWATVEASFEHTARAARR